MAYRLALTTWIPGYGSMRPSCRPISIIVSLWRVSQFKFRRTRLIGSGAKIAGLKTSRICDPSPISAGGICNTAFSCYRCFCDTFGNFIQHFKYNFPLLGLYYWQQIDTMSNVQQKWYRYQPFMFASFIDCCPFDTHQFKRFHKYGVFPIPMHELAVCGRKCNLGPNFPIFYYQMGRL